MRAQSALGITHANVQFMGIVDDVGPDVKNFKKGDRVVASFDLACGACVPAFVLLSPVATQRTLTAVEIAEPCWLTRSSPCLHAASCTQHVEK